MPSTPPPPLLVLLPGLDGTGELFAPLRALAAASFELQVLCYDHAPDQSYTRLAKTLALQLPTQREYTLIAESFGGPLALRLAASSPARLSSVVLVNSFARSPLTLAQKLVLPLLATQLAAAPAWAVRRFMLGDDAPEALVREVQDALRTVPSTVLRARLTTLARCNETETYLHCMAPMFYLQATQDRLLDESSLKLLAYLRPGLVIAPIAAPHLLLQRVPAAALRQLQQWLIEDKQRA